MLSESDARALCLALAQVIPTLLVALYVSVRSSPYHDEKAHKFRIKEMDSALDVVRETQAQYQSFGVEIDGIRRQIRRKRPWQRRSELGELLRVQEKLNAATKLAEAKSSEILAAKEDLIKSGGRIEKALTFYRMSVILCTVVAFFGESAAILGTANVVSLQSALTVALSCTFFVLEIVAQYAITRMTTDLTSVFSKIGWLIGTIAVAIGFIVTFHYLELIKVGP